METGTDPSVAASEEPSPDLAAKLRVRCWGSRGSIPSPGGATAGYGGNTSCVEVRVGERRVIFDAGTGIRGLGNELVTHGGSLETLIFLTHFHWDHIQGFPFFAPLYDDRSHLRIFGPRQEQDGIQALLAGQMGPIYFPVPYEALAARIDFGHLNEGSWEEDGIRITALRMRHPSFTVGYRMEGAGGSICYIPDNELEGGRYPEPREWRRSLVDLIRDADLLLHDAMFTAEEYPAREGWGHSTFEQATDLALEAGAKRLLFFHHAPERSDEELTEIVGRFQQVARERGSPLRVSAAREGEDTELLIEEG